MSEQESSGGQKSDASASSEVSYVPIPEATDSQLEDFLENPELGESEEEDPRDAEGEEEYEEEEPLRNAEQEGSESKLTREQQLEALVEKQKQQIAQQEQYIQHRRNEIGELRKERKELRARLSEGLDEVIDPIEAAKRVRAIEKIDEQLESLDTEQNNNDYIFAQQKIVAKHIKPDEFDIEAMASVLEADGVDPRAIEQFVRNPYSVANGQLIVQIAKRANAETTTKRLIDWTRTLYEENKSLKQKPDQLLDKINRVARQEKPMNSSTGNAKSSTKKASLTTDQIGDLSDAEIEEILRSA